jgi:hypothetical protein
MTCRHGTSDVAPLPVEFASDDELRIYLGLPNTEQGRAIAAAISPEERKSCAQMRAVELELKAGRIPRGVIACDRRPRRRR